jgi:CRP-like cAMP-binding protein
MEMTIASAFTPGGLVGNLSYVLLIGSMAMRDIFLLRILAIFAGITGIAYGAIWLQDPVSVFWESCFTLVNLAQWIALVIERRKDSLTAYQTALRDRVFPMLSNADFLKLLAVATKQTFAAAQALVESGREITSLYLIERGEAAVVVGEVEVSMCQAGDFVGEIGFFNQVPACATVNATPGVECLVFECDALREAMATNPDLERGVSNALNANLATKLIRNNETHTVV